MTRPTRRSFLTGSAAVAAGAATTAALGNVGTADAATEKRPGGSKSKRSGTIRDVEHVVIVMQENRSFDHYYGTLGGVSGLGDNGPLRYPDGTTIYDQPDAKRGSALLPWHLDTAKFNAQEAGDLDHSWPGTHEAWNNGAWNNWVAAKGEETMGYYTRADIPWQYALADAFTICDSYFCSIQGPTTPNRLFHWSGMIDPHGRNGGPAISNPADYEPVYSWTTYPERLEAAGVSWRVYANDEVGDGGGEDGYVGDYGDNPLWLFQAYHDSLASTDARTRRLAERASVRATWKPNSGKGHDVSHLLEQFITDCKAGDLPRVSWVVAPYAYSEHPQARPVDGANYVQRALQAVWGNQELWEKTAILLNFDENDGFFDHVPSPVPALGTADEFVDGLPVGLGPRVPMTVVSPWTRGGWVDSQVFDHTSVLRFLEVLTGVRETNISDWRRAVCGDLTSCFDFTSFDASVPQLPDTEALVRIADNEEKLPPATAPAGPQHQPKPEYADRPRRPLPYRPAADLVVDRRKATVRVEAANDGSVALPLTLWDRAAPVFAGTPLLVSPRSSTSWTGVDVTDYALQVLGPDGFLRDFAGSVACPLTVRAAAVHGREPELMLVLGNTGRDDVVVTITPEHTGGRSSRERVRAGRRVQVVVPVKHERYDVTISTDGLTHRYAGRVE